jgi:WD40 repeat protein
VVPPVPVEAFDHRPTEGITFLEAASENIDIVSLSFNPKQRLLVAGGSYHAARLWDFRSDDKMFNYLLPHIKNGGQVDLEVSVDVSSVHWNQEGTSLVTSSNDMMARTWSYNEESDKIDIEQIKSLGIELMNSKFNKIKLESP